MSETGFGSDTSSQAAPSEPTQAKSQRRLLKWWPWRKKEEWDPSLTKRDFGELQAKEYIVERLNQYLKYYDNTAMKAKKAYLRSRTLSVVAGALVPVLINLDESKVPYVRLVTTVLSVLVVLIVSLESVFHYREQWVNARSTGEALKKEYFLFTTGGGDYAKKDKDKEAFRFFVDQVEARIETENSSTLQVMTREVRDEGGDRSTHTPREGSQTTGATSGSG